MDVFEAYAMSDEAMTKGIWARLVVGTTDIGRVRVRSIDPDINPEYRKGLLTSSMARAAKDEHGEDDAEEIAIALLADTVVTDWELYTTKDGKEVPLKFSKSKCRELLKKLPKFRAAVERAAQNWTRFRAKEFDDAVKS